MRNKILWVVFGILYFVGYVNSVSCEVIRKSPPPTASGYTIYMASRELLAAHSLVSRVTIECTTISRVAMQIISCPTGDGDVPFEKDMIIYTKASLCGNDVLSGSETFTSAAPIWVDLSNGTDIPTNRLSHCGIFIFNATKALVRQIVLDFVFRASVVDVTPEYYLIVRAR